MRNRSKTATTVMVAAAALTTLALSTAPAAPAQAVNSTFLVVNDTAHTLELVHKMQPGEPGFEYRTPRVTPWEPTYLGPYQSHLFDPWYMHFAWDPNATVRYRIAATGETITIVMTPQFDNNKGRPAASCTIQRDNGQPTINSCSVTAGNGSATSTIEIAARSAGFTITNLTHTTIYPWGKDLSGGAAATPSDAVQFEHGATFTRTARTDAPPATYNWMVGITPTKFFTTFRGNPTVERSTTGCVTTTTKTAVLPAYVCFNHDANVPNQVVVTTLPHLGCRYAEPFWYVFMDDDVPSSIRAIVQQVVSDLHASTNLRFTTDDAEAIARKGSVQAAFESTIQVGAGKTLPPETLARTEWKEGMTCSAPGSPIGVPTLNVNAASNFPAVLLKATIMHELLHAVGLGHQDEAPSILASTIKSPMFSPTLTPYDIAAINAMYPAPVVP